MFTFLVSQERRSFVDNNFKDIYRTRPNYTHPISNLNIETV